MSGANFVQAERAQKTPRLTGDAASQKPKIRNAGRIESFVFELDTYCVNGYAAHAKASSTGGSRLGMFVRGRGSGSRSRKIAQTPSQIGLLLFFAPPNAPGPPR